MCADKRRLNVVLCWHMHQPDYRGPDQGTFQLPWVYLHGMKDYVDMAAHLEEHPDARAVVNFAPILLEQLSDYAEQINAWLERGKLIADPLLAALAGPGLPLDQESRWHLIQACLRANENTLIKRFAPFQELIKLAKWVEQHPQASVYLNDNYLTDILVWYHLAWLGESIRSNDLRVQSLQKKAKRFDVEDRRHLVEVIGESVSGIIGRYRTLAESGQVELSVTPYAHPILPLLLDIESAREAIPDIEMPKLRAYPGGEARARWHVRKGLDVFEKHFGFRPQGCWPSEGAVSEETLRLLEEEGFRWAASGQAVLQNSLGAMHDDGPLPENWLHFPYRVHEGRLNCFFRDDGLSDLIGFTYADWHAEDAVGNLVQHLETIAEVCESNENPDCVVSIIMDGENAWEYYPHNGAYFLSTLYERLSNHPRLKLTTFSDCLDLQEKQTSALSRLVAGSWVYGTFSTWIGDPQKNRGWDILGDAKAAYDRVVAAGSISARKLEELAIQLATCEGSDWFWWFGDYNPAATVSDFEHLFRQQLTHLYEMMGEPPPEYLTESIAYGTGDPSLGGVMKRN